MIDRSDEDCSDIGEQILLAWGEKSMAQIAEEMNRELKFVREILKQQQKKIIEQEGGGLNYGEESKG